MGMAVATFVSLAPPNCVSCSYKLYVSLVMIFISIFILSYMRKVFTKYAYGFVIGSLTMMIVFTGEIHMEDFYEVAGTSFVYRLLGVVLGIVLGLVVSQLVFPRKASVELHLNLVIFSHPFLFIYFILFYFIFIF
jgi:hypothetical protein